MDINTIIQGSSIEALTLQDTLPKLSIQNSGPKASGKRSEQQTDALRALKKDPAVLDAKVSIKKQDVPSTEKVSQSPKKTNGFQPRKVAEPKPRLDFDSKMYMEQASLLSLSSDQFSLLLKYVDILREQRASAQRRIECRFCKNNREPEMWYTTHTLKDRKGRVNCPILRSMTCPRCGATGNRAHTVTHCRQRIF